MPTQTKMILDLMWGLSGSCVNATELAGITAAIGSLSIREDIAEAHRGIFGHSALSAGSVRYAASTVTTGVSVDIARQTLEGAKIGGSR